MLSHDVPPLSGEEADQIGLVSMSVEDNLLQATALK